MRKMQGVSLLELLIVLIVIGAIGTIAYPAYQNFLRRLWFAELLKNTESVKANVAECYKKNKTFIHCDNGHDFKPSDRIESLTVKNGVITIIPKETQGILHSDHYILTPTIKDGEVQWISSGKAIDNAYGG